MLYRLAWTITLLRNLSATAYLICLSEQWQKIEILLKVYSSSSLFTNNSICHNLFQLDVKDVYTGAECAPETPLLGNPHISEYTAGYFSWCWWRFKNWVKSSGVIKICEENKERCVPVCLFSFFYLVDICSLHRLMCSHEKLDRYLEFLCGNIMWFNVTAVVQNFCLSLRYSGHSAAYVPQYILPSHMSTVARRTRESFTYVYYVCCVKRKTILCLLLTWVW